MKHLTLWVSLAVSAPAATYAMTCDEAREVAAEAGHNRGSIDPNSLVAVTLDTCKSVERIACMDAIDLSVSSVQKTLALYFEKDPKGRELLVVSNDPKAQHDLNLVRNFNALRKLHEEAFVKIGAFVDSIPSDVENMTQDQLEKFISDDTVKSEKLMSEVDRLSLKDDRFLRFIIAQEKILTDLLLKTGGLISSQACEYLKPVVEKQMQQAQELAQSILYMREFVAFARAKRLILVSVIKEMKKTHVIGRYARALGVEAAKVRADLAAVLRLDDLHRQFGDWWVSSSSGGLGLALDTRYLQFERPRRVMLSSIGRIDNFRKQLKKFEQIPGYSRVMETLASKESIVRDRLERLENKGWEGQASLQVRFAERMLSIASSYVDECRPLLESYIDTFSSPEDFIQYRKAEIQFTNIIDTCKEK